MADRMVWTVPLNPSTEVPFPNLRMLVEGNSSKPDPPIDKTWSELDQLRWHAAVARVNEGVLIDVTAANDRQTRFSVSVGFPLYGSIAGPFDIRSAWTYINGITAGVHHAGRLAAAEQGET